MLFLAIVLLLGVVVAVIFLRRPKVTPPPTTPPPEEEPMVVPRLVSKEKPQKQAYMESMDFHPLEVIHKYSRYILEGNDIESFEEQLDKL